MGNEDHDLNTSGRQVCNSCGHDRSVLTDDGTDKRCAGCDARWPGKTPDPAETAAELIYRQILGIGGPIRVYSDIIRAAYADTVAERDRLANELAEARKQISGDEMVSESRRSENARLRDQLADAQTRIELAHELRARAESELASARWEIEQMKALAGTPELHGCPVTTTDPWDATKREEAEKDDAAEMCEENPDQPLFWWHDEAVKPCGHTSKPLTDSEREELDRSFRALRVVPNDTHIYGNTTEVVEKIVARRIRPECNHEYHCEGCGYHLIEFKGDGNRIDIAPCPNCCTPKCNHVTLDADLTPEDVERLTESFVKATYGCVSADGRVVYERGLRAVLSEFRAGAKRGEMTTDEWGDLLNHMKTWAVQRIGGKNLRGEETDCLVHNYVNSLLTREKGGNS
jgi:hypothetical protein